VENRDLIEGILGRVDERKELGRAVKFEWVKGHAQIHGNVEADKLAVAGATKARE
jgi:ribonuclease HI